MIRYDCLERLAPRVTNQLVVTSGSGQRVEWGHVSKHEGNLFVGSIGSALGVGLGLALALPKRKVLVLESDGSVLLALSILPTVANLSPENLIVLVFDNGVYSGSKISHPTATSGKTDLEAMAKSAGMERTSTVRGIEAFEREASAALAEAGLSFIVAKVEETLLHRRLSRPDVDLLENKYRFVRYVERTEGKRIFLAERAEGGPLRSR